MSSPGGGAWGPREHGQPQHYDPLTGQAVSGGQNQSGPHNASHNPSGMQYQGFGMYEKTRPGSVPSAPNAPAQPPRKNRGPLIAAVALSAVVVVAVVTTVVLVANSSNDEAGELPPPAATSASTPSSAAGESSPESATSADTVVAGWEAVPVPKRGAVYDAPPSWEVDEPDDITAFGPPEDPVTVTGVARYQIGFCPGQPSSHRALTGASAREGATDQEVAVSTARRVAELAYASGQHPPQVTLSEPQQVSLGRGAASGVRVTAVAIHPTPGPCDAPRTLVSVVALSNDGDSSVVHIGMAQQDVPDALPPSVLETMALSFRPLS